MFFLGGHIYIYLQTVASLFYQQVAYLHRNWLPPRSPALIPSFSLPPHYISVSISLCLQTLSFIIVSCLQPLLSLAVSVSWDVCPDNNVCGRMSSILSEESLWLVVSFVYAFSSVSSGSCLHYTGLCLYVLLCSSSSSLNGLVPTCQVNGCGSDTGRIIYCSDRDGVPLTESCNLNSPRPSPLQIHSLHPQLSVHFFLLTSFHASLSFHSLSPLHLFCLSLLMTCG